MTKKIASNGDNSVKLKNLKCRIRLIRSAIIKKASQDGQQNQTTITTNNNYIQNFVHFLKKLKTASEKTQTEQSTLDHWKRYGTTP